MRENRLLEKDEALSKLLRTWKPEVQLPPRFQEVVWQRIEHAESDLRDPFWQMQVGHIEAAFRRPAFAAAYVALLLFLGVGAGYWRGGGKRAQAESEWRTRYVQAVDPYQMPRN